MALDRLERSVAQKVISAYRSVSATAAFLLARTPPLRFLAPLRKKIFEGMKRLQQEGEYTREKIEEVKRNEHADMCER